MVSPVKRLPMTRIFGFDTLKISLGTSGILTLNMAAYAAIGRPDRITVRLDMERRVIVVARPTSDERSLKLANHTTCDPRDASILGKWVNIRYKLSPLGLLPQVPSIYTPQVEDGTLVIHLNSPE